MPRKPTKPKSAFRRWRIILAPLVRAKGVSIYLGVVEAESAEAAVETGANGFGYDARRLIAQPLA